MPSLKMKNDNISASSDGKPKYICAYFRSSGLSTIIGASTAASIIPTGFASEANELANRRLSDGNH